MMCECSFKMYLLCIVPVIFFSNLGFCDNSIPDANDFFVVGDFRDIEVMVPKYGILGSPPSPRSEPRKERPPKSEEDFLYKYVRIEVIERLSLKKGIRVVFVLYEIDRNGKLTTDFPSRNEEGDQKFLYYAYLDVKPKGSKMAGSESPFHKNRKFKLKDELELGILDMCYRSGIKFPLMFTFPPAMNQHKKYKDHSWMEKHKGIVYTEVTSLKYPYYMRIKSSLVYKVHGSEKVKQEDILN